MPSDPSVEDGTPVNGAFDGESMSGKPVYPHNIGEGMAETTSRSSRFAGTSALHLSDFFLHLFSSLVIEFLFVRSELMKQPEKLPGMDPLLVRYVPEYFPGESVVR